MNNNVLLSLLKELEKQTERWGRDKPDNYCIVNAEAYNRGIEVKIWCDKVRAWME